MANSTRKISFYRLGVVKKDTQNRQTTHHLTNEEIHTLFNEMYVNPNYAHPIDGGAVVFSVHNLSIDYVVEVTHIDGKKAFLKIGQENHANTVAIRDQVTYQSSDVPMNECQRLELKSFALIDFDTCVVSYLGTSGFPKISPIEQIFDKYAEPVGQYEASMAVILTDDVLSILTGKAIVNKITCTYAVPQDEILELMGIGENEFDSLQNIKTRTCSLVLSARRNQNFFLGDNKIAHIVTAIREKYGDRLRSLHASAKNAGEKTQDFDLLKASFTKRVDMGEGNIDSFHDADFWDKLNYTYELNKEDIVRYCR